MSFDFKPWEFPSGGKLPEMRLVNVKDPGTGRLYVLNGSPWMLLIRSKDGSMRPLPRTACWLDDGDEVLPPEPLVAAIDAETIRRARVTGMQEYERERDARLACDPVGPGFSEEPTITHRWWWHRRELPHDRVVSLEPGPYGYVLLRVGVNDGINIDGNWWFSDHDAAWRSALGWNGEGDPLDGWVRHLETGRRRKDGTPESEYYNAAEAPDWLRKQHVRARAR